MRKNSELEVLSREEVDALARECLHKLEPFFLEKEKGEKIDPDHSHLSRLSVLFRVIQYTISDAPEETLFELVNPEEEQLSDEEVIDRVQKASLQVAQYGIEIINKGVPWFVELMGFMSEVFRDFLNSEQGFPAPPESKN